MSEPYQYDFFWLESEQTRMAGTLENRRAAREHNAAFSAALAESIASELASAAMSGVFLKDTQ